MSPVLTFNGKHYSLKRTKELARLGDVSALLALESFLTAHPELHEKRALRLVQAYRAKQGYESFDDIRAADKALDDKIAAQEVRADRAWCRSLIERYAAGDTEVSDLITSTPYGSVLFTTFEQAAAGSTKAADQIFKLLGAYAPTESKVDATVDKPALFEI